jgi:hypothetical protein
MNFRFSSLKSCEVLVEPYLMNLKCESIAMGSGKASIRADPYNFPHDNSLSPKTTALVVIDMQRDCERIQGVPTFNYSS